MSQYKAPDGPPPSYPAQAYAGPGGNDARGSANDYYGSPAPQQELDRGFGGGYGQQQPQQYTMGPMGPGPQTGMYQQQPYGQQPPYGYQQGPMMYGPPQGQYYPPHQQQHGSSGAAGGICAGLAGALACCCCLDICLF